MKPEVFLFLSFISIVSVSCNENITGVEILQRTIASIDTIETICYKQEMTRTNPRDTNDTLSQYREMYFKRLVNDSLVGVMGHWYMYGNDKKLVVFEDIYTGNRLVRKNNRDSTAMIYDFIEHPGLKRTLSWGHNTLYGMQYEFSFFLENKDLYIIERLNDTVINENDCFQIKVSVCNKISMPGFAMKPEDKKGNVSVTSYCIDKESYYPVKMKGESYSADNPGQTFFIDQRYYDIRFNTEIDEDEQFNTTEASIAGFEIVEIKP